MTVRSLQKQIVRSNGTRRRLPSGPLSPSVFVARALVVRAMRKAGLHHVLQNVPCTIGIVGVESGAIDAVSSAARHIMGAWLVGNLGYDVVIYDRTDRTHRRETNVRSIVLDAAKAGERGAMLFSALGDVPPAFAASAEGIVVLEPVDRRVVKGAFMSVAKRAPDQGGLDIVASLPLDLLDSVIVAGRSSERSVGVALKLLAAVANEAEPVEELPKKVAEGSGSAGPCLADLSGLGAVGEWGEDLARDLADYRSGTLPWSDVDKGVLVAGPPGVGKTMFAGALGRSCGVPVHVHSCASWQAKGHLGDLLKAMRRAFDEARKSTACILFLDEMDAFGSRADPSEHSAAYMRQVIDGLLEQLDGAVPREGVVVVGATNHPDLIDPALLRPGRLERVLHMRLPDLTARIGILRHHLRDMLPAADLSSVAERLDGTSGAEIELVVRSARRRARRRREAMTLADVEAGLPRRMRMSEALFRRACVHEAGHLVVGAALMARTGNVPVVARVMREVRGNSCGHTDFLKTEGFDRTVDSHVAEIAVLLAGGVAEEAVLGQRGEGSGGGSGSDLHLATVLATRMEASFGLGGSLLHLMDVSTADVGQVIRSDGRLRDGVEVFLARSRDESEQVVSAFYATVTLVAHELERIGEVSFERLRTLFPALDKAAPRSLENRCQQCAETPQNGLRAPFSMDSSPSGAPDGPKDWRP